MTLSLGKLAARRVRCGSVLVGSGSVLVLSMATAPAYGQRALGLDISAWQGDISQTTWNNIKTVENRQFVFLRSSRGGKSGYYNQNNAGNNNPAGQNTLSQRYDDPYFVQNINRATTAGMYAGSYHFSRPDIIATTLNANGIANTGTDEADHFIQMAGAFMRPGYLLPTHDLEAGDGIRTDDAMAQFNMDFSNRIYEKMGIRPAVYINGNYAANILAQSTSPTPAQTVAAYPVLWSARWPNQTNPNSIDVQGGNPKDSYTPIYGPWDDAGVTHPWHFWQYASTGRLQSFSNGGANLDFDVANGGVEYLRDHLVPALWMNDSDGQWTTLTNWNSGIAPVAPVTGAGQVAAVGTQTLPTPRLPGAAGSGVTAGSNDTVILDRPNANIAVTYGSGTTNIRKLYAKETLNITGGSFTINYVPAADSTPIAAEFSSIVTLSGSAALSVHTLQVDGVGGQFSINGGTTTFRQITLKGDPSISGKMVIGGSTAFTPLVAGETAVISTTTGAQSGRVDLGGAARTLTINNGTAAIDMSVRVPVTNGGLTKSGTGTLELASANTYAAGTIVNGGTLIAAHPNALGTGALTVSNATVEAKSDLTTGLSVHSIAAIGTGKFDLTNDAMVVKNSTLNSVALLVKQGYNHGNWLGGGITSSLAATNPSGLTAVGFMGNDQLHASAFEGVTGLDSDDVLVKYTYYGDADLSGSVDADDFNSFLAGFQSSSLPRTWLYGDFDYNGLVDADDFNLFLAAYQAGGSPLSEIVQSIETASLSAADQATLLGAVAAVPEPGSLAAIGLVSGLVLRRRRHT